MKAREVALMALVAVLFVAFILGVAWVGNRMNDRTYTCQTTQTPPSYVTTCGYE